MNITFYPTKSARYANSKRDLSLAYHASRDAPIFHSPRRLSSLSRAQHASRLPPEALRAIGTHKNAVFSATRKFSARSAFFYQQQKAAY